MSQEIDMPGQVDPLEIEAGNALYGTPTPVREVARLSLAPKKEVRLSLDSQQKTQRDFVGFEPKAESKASVQTSRGTQGLDLGTKPKKTMLPGYQGTPLPSHQGYGHEFTTPFTYRTRSDMNKISPISAAGTAVGWPTTQNQYMTSIHTFLTNPKAEVSSSQANRDIIPHVPAAQFTQADTGQAEVNDFYIPRGAATQPPYPDMTPSRKINVPGVTPAGASLSAPTYPTSVYTHTAAGPKCPTTAPLYSASGYAALTTTPIFSTTGRTVPFTKPTYASTPRASLASLPPYAASLYPGAAQTYAAPQSTFAAAPYLYGPAPGTCASSMDIGSVLYSTRNTQPKFHRYAPNVPPFPGNVATQTPMPPPSAFPYIGVPNASSLPGIGGQSGVEHHYIASVPSNRVPSLPPFSGEGKKDDLEFDVWKNDVCCLLTEGVYPQYSILEAIRRSLKGKARSVLVHLGEKATAQGILRELEGIFGNVASSEKLIETFYSAHQTQNESIADYSIRLEQLLSKTKLALDEHQKNSMLCSKLWSGLSNQYLKYITRFKYESIKDFGELRRQLRQVEQEVNTCSQSLSSMPVEQVSERPTSAVEDASNFMTFVESKLLKQVEGLSSQMKSIDSRLSKLEEGSQPQGVKSEDKVQPSANRGWHQNRQWKPKDRERGPADRQEEGKGGKDSNQSLNRKGPPQKGR